MLGSAGVFVADEELHSRGGRWSSDSEPPEFHWRAPGGSLSLDHQPPARVRVYHRKSRRVHCQELTSSGWRFFSVLSKSNDNERVSPAANLMVRSSEILSPFR